MNLRTYYYSYISCHGSFHWLLSKHKKYIKHLFSTVFPTEQAYNNLYNYYPEFLMGDASLLIHFIRILHIYSKLNFRHTLAESATFPSCSETGMWCFRPGYGEKWYTHYGNKIAQPTARVCHPRLRLGWQFTQAMECPSFFLTRCVIYY